MASVKVIIYDPTGSKKTPVELPNDVPMRRLIPALVSKMGLPTTQGANPITYRLDHRDSGKRLSEDESLLDAGVGEDGIWAAYGRHMGGNPPPYGRHMGGNPTQKNIFLKPPFSRSYSGLSRH